MSDETVQIGPRIPAELKRLLDADDRPNREIVTEALWREYGGKKKSLVEMQIQRKKERLESLREEQQGLAEEADELESELTALQDRVETLEGESDALDSDLDTILDRMEDGEHMWPEAAPIESVATDHGLSADDVLQRLRHRAADQGREITTHQFHRADRPPAQPDRPVTEVYDGDE